MIKPVKRALGLILSLTLTAGAVACGLTSGTDAPKLAKFGDTIPEPDIPKPPEPPPAPPATVAEVTSRGCTTTVVKGLSEQIIAEGNCLAPGAYAQLPKLTNVKLDPAVFPYLAEPARDALVGVLRKARGSTMKINSMLRTVAQQYLLYRWYRDGRCGISLAARPGESNHQSGLALDIAAPRPWRKRMQRAGFRWMGKRDKWHFDFVKEKVARPKSLDLKAFQILWNRNNPSDRISEDGDFGPSTERALRRSPADGFPIGAQCG